MCVGVGVPHFYTFCHKRYDFRKKKVIVPNFHIRTVYLDIIKVFTPTDAQVFKRSIKVYIKTAPTCFGVITIIRERTI